MAGGAVVFRGAIVERFGTFAAAVALSTLILSPDARAQDWSGFYFGANLGGAWGNSDASTNVDCNSRSNVNAYICSATALQSNGVAEGNAGSGGLSDDGVTGGGQAGYNAQSGHFVYGVELDFNALDLHATRQGAGGYTPNGAFTIGSSLATNWLFTTRGRLGWNVSHVLVYATGGLAVTDLEVTSTYSDNLGPGTSLTSSSTDTKVGYVVGGGVEWMLTGNWTMRGEYLYVDFGSVSTSGLLTNAGFPGQSNPFSTSEDLSAHIARAGVNYRFDHAPN